MKISSSCDPVRRDAGYYSILRPELVDPQVASAPYLIRFEELYERYGQQRALQRQDNVGEWWERFCRVPRTKDIDYLIYETPVEEVDRLRTAIGSTTIPLPLGLSANTFARYLVNHKCLETVDYLVYAKRCEPFVQARSAWDTTPRNTMAMQRLIDEGRSRFRSIESHYMRLRYAYQMIRLAHYMGDYGQVIELHDYLMPKIDHDPSLIAYWIEGHLAGALLALEENVEASYHYARVFLNCPSRRESALRSYRLRTDEEWEKCFLMCQDDRERAALYAMRAYAPDSRTVEEMHLIYDLDPENESLEPLMVKEMGELERTLLGRELRPVRAGEPDRNDLGEEAIQLQNFVRRVLNDGLVDRPAFWKIAEGYLELLAGDNYAAAKTFNQAEGIVSDKNLKLQLELFQLLLKINSWDRITEDVEREIARMRRTELYQSDPDFAALLKRKIVYLYRQTGELGKSFLSQYPLRALKPNPQPAIVEDLVRIARKPDPTAFERQMLAKKEGGTILNDLLDIRATMLFSDYQLEAAMETYRQMDITQWDNYGLFNPYLERIKDCVHCAIPDSFQVFNRGQLIQQLLDLEYDARAHPEKAAQNYYRMGVAFYNMSYFSYAWKAMDYYRSGASISPRFMRDGDNVTPLPNSPYGNIEHFDCSHALMYFQRARQMTDDPELGARATFWAAKCERNQYYVDRVRGIPRRYEYFTELKQRYSGTRYYARVVEECKTFASFAAK